MDEFDYEDDDDVFYSELRRQILQLTVEDDQEGSDDLKSPTVIRTQRPDDGGCYNWTWSNRDQTLGHVWCWGGNVGTGVFIPQVVHPWTKYRPRKKKTAKRKKKKTEA